ncbi:MAG TPA: hypothetical protein VKA84_13700, partial [Gemmatimonadaceae bacterium]|nr:hypothetical protein [Gemmatimonadaceae bacterium]
MRDRAGRWLASAGVVALALGTLLADPSLAQRPTTPPPRRPTTPTTPTAAADSARARARADSRSAGSGDAASTGSPVI